MGRLDAFKLRIIIEYSKAALVGSVLLGKCILHQCEMKIFLRSCSCNL